MIGDSNFGECEQEAKEKEAKAMGITVEELQGMSFLSSGIGGYFLDINRKIKQLKLNIFKRFNNVLDSRQRVYLENEIRNLMFDIDMSVKELPQGIKQKVSVEYQKMKEGLLECKEKEQGKEIEENKKRVKIDEVRTKTRAIMDLSPEAFEEYIASLFASMGYKVELTPRSGDAGIDILLYKDDKKIAVQCKKYSKKNLVGSPDMQRFLGAIHNSNAVKGIFITTSFFTLEAERFARNNPIELLDSVKLEKLISEILVQVEGEGDNR